MHAVDSLKALSDNLVDPNNVLESWDSSLVNPCTWFHVTCNTNNNVIRIDLGNSGLSGQLVSDLGNLKHLQYLILSNNKLTGPIPTKLGGIPTLNQAFLLDNNPDPTRCA
ncbi:unnamed protein product [Cuscuta campestris]|uniref:Leucine-rich repeat-containing N-terminal plant-type domain-containing protein n=1 Tax=Cuscuta campestris TaxID=132261 RepID=A0A484MJ28_9ASTE|nr:unnamed protein product [Cuscuta campestris]